MNMNINYKNVLAIIGISACTTFMSIWGFARWARYNNNSVETIAKLPANYANFINGAVPTTATDFTLAASAASPAVVHIKTKTNAKRIENGNSQRQRNPFFDFFGEDPFGDYFGGPRMMPEQRASGSGVLITGDGYIVTNNHVISGADEISVTLTNKKVYKAKVIGADPNSDIAVIKIEASNMPYLVYGNSDDVKLGQWVLAIGYPLTLDVTITAGIISAKNRSIDVNSRQGDKPIESFLQTDAAVNQGNSGGALVNINGELVGINSAIMSPTGSYAGYSYAIPVNIVKKVVTDIVKFGTVQRAYLGVSMSQEDMTEEQIKKIEADLNIKYKPGEGVLITNVLEGGAADASKLKAGDVITKYNGIVVKSSPELQEQVSKNKPGDKVTLTIKRNDSEMTVDVLLKAKLGNADIAKSSKLIEKLGGKLETLDKATADKNEINGGVIIKELGTGVLSKSSIEKGFVIMTVNDQLITNLNEFYEAINKSNGSVKLGGFYPGYYGTYAFILNLRD
jgi:Do/DeqQ family serine protease